MLPPRNTIKWLLVGLVVFLVALAAGSFGKRTKSGLRFDSMEFNAGDVKGEESSVVRHRFSFTNADSRPITISKIATTCGCMEATASKSTLLPGESGTLEAAMRLLEPGEKTVLITVYSDGESSPAVLRLTANYIPSAFASVVPTRLTLVSPARDPEPFQVHVFTLTTEPPEVSVSASSPAIKASVRSKNQSEVRVGAGYVRTTYDVAVSIEGRQDQPKSPHIRIQFAGGVISPIQLPIEIRPREEWELSPSKLFFFGGGEAMSSSSQAVRVRRLGGQPVSFLGVDNQNARWLEVGLAPEQTDGLVVLKVSPTKKMPQIRLDVSVDAKFRVGDKVETISIPVAIRPLK